MSHHRFEQALRREHVREQLAALQPGGSPQRAIRVVSAAVIEPRAAKTPCPHCGGFYRIDEHTAVRGLRRADVTCRHCSVPRTLWFRIVDPHPN